MPEGLIISKSNKNKTTHKSISGYHRQIFLQSVRRENFLKMIPETASEVPINF